MSTSDTYLAVFLSNKTSPRWQAWSAMPQDERRAKDEAGLAALKAWDEAHRDAIVYMGGPLGPTKRTSADGVADVVNELTVFVVVRAPSHEAAAKLFEGHPHFTIFPCDCVDVMPLLSGPPDA
jgi:hypothetical protein